MPEALTISLFSNSTVILQFSAGPSEKRLVQRLLKVKYFLLLAYFAVKLSRASSSDPEPTP